MAEATQYSGQNNVLTFLGINITAGLADGDDAISIEISEDTMKKTVGMRGDGIFSRSADHSGEIKLKYIQNSSSGKFLSAKLNAIKSGAIVVGPLILSEVGGDAKVVANKTTIKKQAPFKRGNGQNYVEFELVSLDITIIHGMGEQL